MGPYGWRNPFLRPSLPPRRGVHPQAGGTREDATEDAQHAAAPGTRTSTAGRPRRRPEPERQPS
jgi:hypothetical protein